MSNDDAVAAVMVATVLVLLMLAWMGIDEFVAHVRRQRAYWKRKGGK